MASFVTEVLASSGKLAKEDLHSKINSLSKHVNDVKNEVQETLDSRYISFFPCLKETLELSNRISSVSNEMKVLSNCIENEAKEYFFMKVELQTSNQDIQELSQQLTEITVTLNLVEKLLSIHKLLASVSENLNEKDYLLAAKSLEDIKSGLRENVCVGEDQVKIFKALKSEYVIRREKLMYDLGEKWNENIVWTLDTLNVDRLQVDLSVNMPNPEKVTEVTSLLKAMQLMGYLDQKLKIFANHFLNHLCKPIISHSAEIETSSKASSLTLRSNVDKKTRSAPCEVLRNLSKVFDFLSKSLLKIRVKDDEGHVTLMTKLGQIVSKDLCDVLIKECLSTAIPDSKDNLKDYQQVVDQTVLFQKQLAEYEFLNADQQSILDYARNVDVHFTNKMCQDILQKARTLMLKDLHDLANMPATEIPQEEVPKEYQDPIKKALFKSEQSTFATADKLSKNIFIFPACAISTSVQDLVSLMYTTLKEAATSSTLCAARLFYTCRNIVELFCDVVPGYHKHNLSTLPQLSAVFHNNCMYVGHHLMTLGHQFHQHSQSTCKDKFTTFVDLIPRVRQVGSEVFLNQMLAQKRQIMETLHELGGFHNMANDEKFLASLERALRQCLHQLFFLKRIWETILPLHVYCQSIGTLLNTLIEELIYQTTSQEDIPSDSTVKLISTFSNVLTKSPQLFKVENDDSSSVLDVHQYVGKWMKFKELLLILGGSMRDILDRWAEGKGPLAHEFTATSNW